MKKKLCYLPVGLLFLCGFVFGMCRDLEISEALFARNNLFGILMASIGELPMYGGVAFAGGLLVMSVRRLTGSKALRALSVAGAAAVTAFGVVFMGKAFCSINAWGALCLALEGNAAVSIPVGLVFVLPCLYLGLRLGRRGDAGTLLRVSLAVLMTGVLQIAVITVMKGVYHRPRFRSLAESGAQFQPVFVRLQDYARYITDAVTKEEFKSFPSGHTGSGAVIMILAACLPYFAPKAEIKKQPLYFGIAALYTAVLAVSRITVGAHYLTDVCFGGLVTLVFTLLADLVTGLARSGKSGEA